MDNRFNKVFPSFDSLNSEFSPSSCLIDIFSSHFSFYLVFKHKDNNLEDCSNKLNNIAIISLLNHSHALTISDAGIKNNVATSITHIHVHDKPVIKTIHHATNVTSTEAELFAIRCDINQAVNLPGISKIVIIIDSIHAAKKIFDSVTYPFQSQLAAISEKLRKFFITNINNSIKFWKCPSCCDWPLFKAIDRDTKLLHQTPLFLSKLLWDFSKKSKCNDISHNWKMTFQVYDLKGQQFLELVDDDNNPIEPSYVKGGSWLKFIGYSNLLCAKATRAIVSHAPIEEYRLCFFLKEEFKCPCGIYPIESRHHILHKCRSSYHGLPSCPV